MHRQSIGLVGGLRKACEERCLRSALILAALVCSSAASAADKLILPIAPVLAQPATQRALGGTPVQFGMRADAARTAAPVGSTVHARSWARPYDRSGLGGTQLPDGRLVPMTTEQTCNLALRYTLGDLVEEARNRGGKAVVDIVSFTDEVEMNSETSFECVPGRASSTVTLRGRAAEAVPAR
ncbi:MAG: hypothetical protein EOO25_01050 [Comamonadaceae bacterium]|nr:MAG: hypothetical protein EOO25_01050 [Comamonadaceae bacterium]